MKGFGKRFFSVFLALVMVVGLMPTSALAAEDDVTYDYHPDVNNTATVTGSTNEPEGNIPVGSHWVGPVQSEDVTCGKEAHEHDDSCYEAVWMICTEKTDDNHVHIKDTETTGDVVKLDTISTYGYDLYKEIEAIRNEAYDSAYEEAYPDDPKTAYAELWQSTYEETASEAAIKQAVKDKYHVDLDSVPSYLKGVVDALIGTIKNNASALADAAVKAKAEEDARAAGDKAATDAAAAITICLYDDGVVDCGKSKHTHKAPDCYSYTWTLEWNTYTVTYDYNGGVDADNKSSKVYENVTHGDNTPAAPSVSKEGFYFGGWGNVADIVTETVTYTAIWDAECTVSFEGYDSYKVKAGEMVSAPAPDPTQSGKLFQYWAVEDEKATFPYTVEDSVEFVAVWENNRNDKYGDTHVDGSEADPYTYYVWKDGNEVVKEADWLAGEDVPTAPVIDTENDGKLLIGWTESYDEETRTYTYIANWKVDSNNNGVKDVDETVTVSVTGEGAVTVNGNAVASCVYNSEDDETVTIVATPVDGSYVSGIKVDNGENVVSIENFNSNRSYTYTFTPNGSQTVNVSFEEAAFALRNNNVLTFYHGIDTPSDKKVYNTVIDTPAYDAEKVDTIYYLAREAGVEVEIDIPDWLATLLKIDDPYIYKLPEQWLPIGTEIPDVDVDAELQKVLGGSYSRLDKLLTGVASALMYYECDEFGYNPTSAESVTEILKITYADNQKVISDDDIEIVLTDNRTATTLSAKDVTVTYGNYTVESLKSAITPAVIANGAVVDGLTVTYSMEDKDLADLDVGTYTLTLKYAGSEKYKPSQTEVTITVNKAPVELTVDVAKNVVKYGEDYNAVVSVDPEQVTTIQFVVGLNVNGVQLKDESLVGWATELNLIMPGTLGELLAKYVPAEGISSSDLLTVLDNAKTILVMAGMSEETLNGVISTIEQMQEQFGTLTIKLNADMPTDIGLYVIGAVTADPNYETKLAVNYVAITPDGYKAELDWKIDDANGIITLPVVQDGTYDLSAYVTRVYEGTVDEAEKELVNLFLGVDTEGNFVVTKDQTELTAGAYTEISYILNWGNTMYYAQPIARAFVVVPQLMDVKFIDESGAENNDRTFTYDGTAHAMDVAVNGVKTAPGGNLTVTYYGVQSNGETYNSTSAPVHAGAYTAVAMYVERNAAGEVVKMGADVGAMVIKPAEAIIAVDNAHHIYDGKAYDVMNMVKSTPADAKVALLTCGINLDGDFSEEGLSALSGQANLDLPAAADKVFAQYLPEVYENGLTVSAVTAKLDEYADKFAELGIVSDTLESLSKLISQLPNDTILTFKDQVNPANVGAYLVVGMIFDPDYIPELGAGILTITPKLNETYLKFNTEDDNGIFTIQKMTKADLGASAYNDEACTTKNDAATGMVKTVFLGVDDQNGLIVTDDAAALTSGVYVQLAFIGELNARYYAEPISRPVIVVPSVADVAIVDAKGNENYAQVFTYDGKAKPVTVTVDGKAGPMDGLTVMYIGSDTTVDGWCRTEAPTDAGVYTVVAVYTEKNGTELTKAGGAVGVLVIEPADAEVGLEDATYVYDGEEHFATITNTALDYITVAIDRANNIAYVNLPDDTAEHIDRILGMLPAQAETELRTLLSKYNKFDGDVQTQTVKAELTAILEKLIAADMTTEAKSLVDQLAEKLTEELSKSTDVDAMIQEIKTELSAIKDAAVSDISGELKAALQKYVDALEGADIDVEQVKAEIKDMIVKIEGDLPQEAIAELNKLVDELVAAVQTSVDMSALKAEVTEILSELEVLDLSDAKTLAKYVIGAVYSQIDMEEIQSLLEEAVAKVQVRGYVDYLKNLAKSIAGMYKGDTTKIDDLIAKIEAKLADGSIQSAADLEETVDAALTELKAMVDKIPDGTIVFGKNPTEVGEYDCYAMNISANYKAEFVKAELVIKAPTVTFDLNYGSDRTYDTIETGKDATLNELPQEPTREGYTFNGWFTETSGGSQITTDTVFAGDTTVYAQWAVKKYTITFNTDGGTTVDAITLPYSTAVTAPADPTRTGYTFAGWDAAIPATMPAKDMTITAKWTINQYTITFNTVGGSEIAAITQDYGTAVTAPADPSKTGYTFAGWDVEVPATMPAKDMTITAQWTINQYTITFDTAGGSEIAAITQDYGTAVTAPADPSKTGYTFAGWDVEVPATMPAENMTITAKWTINQYTITFNTDGGSEVAAITLPYGATVTAPANPTREGYTFAGWDLEIPTTMPAKDMTITAKWTEKEPVNPPVNPDEPKDETYTITFDANGGKVDVSTAETGTDGKLSTLPDATREGYEFSGWYTAAGEKVTLETVFNADAIVTAKWTEKEPVNPPVDPDEPKDETYTITFDANGGKVNVSTAETGTDGKLSTLPDATRDGYEFGGWYTAAGEKVTLETVFNADATVTAKWTEKEPVNPPVDPDEPKDETYTITFDANGGKVNVSTAETGTDGKLSTLPDATRDGYTFDGWYTASEGGEKVDTATVFTADATIYAQWIKKNDGGNGSGGSGSSGGSGGSSDKDETPDIADPDETGVSNYLITDVHDAFMVGDDKGTFRPNANITRAEAAQVFYNLLKNKNVAVTVDFDDVAEDAWYAAAVNTLGSMGIVNGVGDNKFEPQRAITRAEFAAIAVRFTEKTVSGYDFDDVPKDHWAYTAISTAAAYGWVNGISEDQFAPDRNITRAEVAKIVNHMLGRLGDQEEIDSGAGRAFPDVTKSHWAWYEIAEATTDHDCKFNASRTEETWKK